MAKSDSKKAPELLPDAWERFRSAVHTMTKAGPQHRKPAEKIKRKAAKSPSNDGRKSQSKKPNR
jgi:hypothetical protein